MAGNSKQRGGDDAEETVCCVSKRSIGGLPMTRTAMLLSPQLKVAHEHKSGIQLRPVLRANVVCIIQCFPSQEEYIYLCICTVYTDRDWEHNLCCWTRHRGNH